MTADILGKQPGLSSAPHPDDVSETPFPPQTPSLSLSLPCKTNIQQQTTENATPPTGEKWHDERFQSKWGSSKVRMGDTMTFRVTNQTARAIRGRCRQFGWSESEFVRRASAELLGRMGDDTELVAAAEETREIRERFASLQEELARLRRSQKEAEKVAAQLRELQESLQAQVKPKKPGHWAAIVARAPHLLPALERAVQLHEAGRPVVDAPPALVGLRQEAGSWAAALAAVKVVAL